MGRIVVAGAGIGGLGSALYLSRAGHGVTVVERDATPLPGTAAEAFGWERRGAPQVRHSHAFLARLRNQLLADHPDVLDRLLEVGATEMGFISMLPEGMDRMPMDGDDELVALACRRTTFEWVLRRLVLDGGAVRILHGTAVDSLVADARPVGAVPRVSGVRLTDGSEVPCDAVVLAGGRRMDVPSLLADIGVDVAEHTEDTGIVYLSRFYRLNEGEELPAQLGPIGGDLGYLKYGVFPGDDRTFSVTLAADTADSEMRRLLAQESGFTAAAGALAPTSGHVDGRATPITGVEVMGGLINRRRDFLVDGSPVVTGVHALGDAHTATNPLYGRGCSLAMVQASLLCEALTEPDATSAAVAYEQANLSEVLPWHRAAVAQDRLGRSADDVAHGPESTDSRHGGLHSGYRSERSADGPPQDAQRKDAPHRDAPLEDSTRSEFVRSMLRDGLLPAVREDPVVLRAFLRMFNLLEAPDSLMSDPDVLGRVLDVYQRRDSRPPEQPLGPDRATMVSILEGAAGA